MKKITLLALLCSMFMAPLANAQEVTYVEDPSQGYLQNKFKDNWFISAEAGIGGLGSQFDSKLGFGKRIMPTANISFGKWFSPIIGLRLGVDGQKLKGATNTGLYIDPKEAKVDGYNIQKYWQVGPAADVMLNLTNWWCGYRPGRVYNGILYAGMSAHCILAKDATKTDDYKYSGTAFGARLGLLNTFAISKQVDFLIDLRMDMNQTHIDNHNFDLYGSLMAGFAYKFKKREWNAPITAVCPQYKYTDAEGDALVSRLQAADAKISSLENQLKNCMNRPQPKANAAAVENTTLATIYFPIGSSRVNGANANLVKALANAMKDSDSKYTVTGWADSYTGSAKYNEKLREARANNVAKILKKRGVAADKLTVNSNSENLTKFGSKSASLDRAVTISVD
ncbi:MAG: OmpA family protein [Muribaculaceae bacterium]|nr:OmpA family protein [Muribaculaceae bacterium]